MVLDLLEANEAAPLGTLVKPEVDPAAHTSIALSRQLRINELKRAIEAGEYRVPACDLADALLRFGRRAN